MDNLLFAVPIIIIFLSSYIIKIQSIKTNDKIRLIYIFYITLLLILSILFLILMFFISKTWIVTTFGVCVGSLIAFIVKQIFSK